MNWFTKRPALSEPTEYQLRAEQWKEIYVRQLNKALDLARDPQMTSTYLLEIMRAARYAKDVAEEERATHVLVTLGPPP